MKGLLYEGVKIGWECSRYIEPVKSLNVRETMKRNYSEFEKELIRILDGLEI